MKVENVMTTHVRTCGPRDTLDRAAQLLWENDCGALPVVDEAGTLRAMITDRDICMAAYTTGERLTDLLVEQCMAPRPVSCRPDDPLTQAAERMAEHQVRRLPVVDGKDRVQGLLSLNDLVLSAPEGSSAVEATKVLRAVSKHRAVQVPAKQEKAELQPTPGRGRKGANVVAKL